MWCVTLSPLFSFHAPHLPPTPLLLNLPGVVSLSQALCSSDEYSNSLLHLDLSKNPGVLSGDDASVRERCTEETESQNKPRLLRWVFPT